MHSYFLLRLETAARAREVKYTSEMWVEREYTSYESLR